MRTKIKTVLLFAFALITELSFSQNVNNKIAEEEVNKAIETSQNSLTFIENKGQWPAHVLFRADVPGGQMLATQQGMLVGKYDPQSLDLISKYDAQIEEIDKGFMPGMAVNDLGPEPMLKGHGWRFNFAGGSLANAQSVNKSGETPEYFNFFIGDPSAYEKPMEGWL